ncbi:MAG: hypothetical protein ACKO0V_10000 [bacterium]
MRKTSLSILCASLLAVVLSGCGGSEPAPAPAPAAKTETKAPEAGKATAKKTKGVESESNTPARRRDKE